MRRCDILLKSAHSPLLSERVPLASNTLSFIAGATVFPLPPFVAPVSGVRGRTLRDARATKPTGSATCLRFRASVQRAGGEVGVLGAKIKHALHLDICCWADFSAVKSADNGTMSILVDILRVVTLLF